MAVFELDAAAVERLQSAMERYAGDTEQAINDVLHNQASPILQDSIKQLIPQSRKSWKGKKPAARTAKSLTDKKENLAITVKTSNAYQYLYFPDDGTNTKRHVGYKGVPREFFKRGGEAKTNTIIDLCVSRLVDDFEN